MPDITDVCSDLNCQLCADDRAQLTALAALADNPNGELTVTEPVSILLPAVGTTAAAVAALAAVRGELLPIGAVVDFDPPKFIRIPLALRTDDGIDSLDARQGVISDAYRGTDRTDSYTIRIPVNAMVDDREYVVTYRDVQFGTGITVTATATTDEWTDAARTVQAENDARLAARTAVAAGRPPARVLPHNAMEAIALARGLADVSHLLPDADALAARYQDLARLLPGGELQDIAHEHAATADLCGEYEVIVCPTFGWLPRNGRGSSMARQCGAFYAAMDEHVAAMDGQPALAVVQSWLARFEAGSIANRAICDHAESHLESYKREGANRLLTEVLGWEPISCDREYEVTVRVEREITVTAWQDVVVTVTATDADVAADLIDEYQLADATDDYNWEIDDIGYHRTARRDIDSHDVVDVNEV